MQKDEYYPQRDDILEFQETHVGEDKGFEIPFVLPAERLRVMQVKHTGEVLVETTRNQSGVPETITSYTVDELRKLLKKGQLTVQKSNRIDINAFIKNLEADDPPLFRQRQREKRKIDSDVAMLIAAQKEGEYRNRKKEQYEDEDGTIYSIENVHGSWEQYKGGYGLLFTKETPKSIYIRWAPLIGRPTREMKFVVFVDESATMSGPTHFLLFEDAAKVLTERHANTRPSKIIYLPHPEMPSSQEDWSIISHFADIYKKAKDETNKRKGAYKKNETDALKDW